MVITIIGSMSKKDSMITAKKFFEKIGDTVKCPCEEIQDNWPLISKQLLWINAIKEADLVVAIPKKVEHGDYCDLEASYKMEFGESTSYEMAIAIDYNKPILVWVGYSAYPLSFKDIKNKEI